MQENRYLPATGNHPAKPGLCRLLPKELDEILLQDMNEFMPEYLIARLSDRPVQHYQAAYGYPKDEFSIGADP